MGMCGLSFDRGLAGPGDPADAEIVEGGDRIRLGPQADPAAGAHARVPVIEEQLTIGSGVREAGVHRGWPETDARRSFERALDAVADHDDAQRVPVPECLRRETRARELVAAAVVMVETEIARAARRNDHVERVPRRAL